MRTIIISDITENHKSIIPYGLNVGKWTDTKVDILHYIDTRLIQGKYSSFSDSQSITPGVKLSAEELLQREKKITENKLDKLLSKEASKLNYPLRTNSIVEIVKNEDSFIKKIKEYADQVIISAVNPTKSMFNDIDELFDSLEYLNSIIMLVSSELDFVKPQTAILLIEIAQDNDKKEKIHKALKLIKAFDATVYCAVFMTNNAEETASKIKKWKQLLKAEAGKYVDDDFELLKKENRISELQNFIKRKNPDLVVLPKSNKTDIGNIIVNDNISQFIETVKKPLVFY